MKKILTITYVFLCAIVVAQAQIKVKNNDALIILNGQESSTAALENIDPNQIEFIEFIKSKEAKRTYGKKAKDGAIIVQLKWNKEQRDLYTLFDDGPLFILAERYVSREALGEIDPNNIVSIEVLKGESAINKFGEKGKNGVVIINLKSTNKFKSFLPIDND